MYTNQGVPGGVTVVSQNVLRERKPISKAVIAPVDPGTDPALADAAVAARHSAATTADRQVIVPLAPPPAPLHV